MAGGVRLRVMTYNIHGLHDDAGALVGVVREAAPDVLVVQEALRRLRWRSFTAGLARRFGMYYAGGGNPCTSSGNVIMTAMRVRAHAEESFRYVGGRGAVLVRCSVGRTRFLVAGTHLSTEPVERLRQAAEFKAALDRATVPVLVGGDLNDDPAGPAWRTVADGLVDAAQAAGAAGAATFPRSGRRIDAIFVDPSFAVAGCAVLDTPGTRAASDHRPVLADIALPG